MLPPRPFPPGSRAHVGCAPPVSFAVTVTSQPRHVWLVTHGCRTAVTLRSLSAHLCCVRSFSRLTYESLSALEIPSDMLQAIQDLILDLRVRCVMVTLQHTAEGVSARVDVCGRRCLLPPPGLADEITLRFRSLLASQ